MDATWTAIRDLLAKALDLHLRGGQASSFSWAVMPGSPPKVGLYPTGSNPWDGPIEELDAARAEALRLLEGMDIPTTMPSLCPAIAWEPLSAHALLAQINARDTTPPSS